MTDPDSPNVQGPRRATTETLFLFVADRGNYLNPLGRGMGIKGWDQAWVGSNSTPERGGRQTPVGGEGGGKPWCQTSPAHAQQLEPHQDTPLRGCEEPVMRASRDPVPFDSSR